MVLLVYQDSSGNYYGYASSGYYGDLSSGSGAGGSWYSSGYNGETEYWTWGGSGWVWMGCGTPDYNAPHCGTEAGVTVSNGPIAYSTSSGFGYSAATVLVSNSLAQSMIGNYADAQSWGNLMNSVSIGGINTIAGIAESVLSQLDGQQLNNILLNIANLGENVLLEVMTGYNNGGTTLYFNVKDFDGNSLGSYSRYYSGYSSGY